MILEFYFFTHSYFAPYNVMPKDIPVFFSLFYSINVFKFYFNVSVSCSSCSGRIVVFADSGSEAEHDQAAHKGEEEKVCYYLPYVRSSVSDTNSLNNCQDQALNLNTDPDPAFYFLIDSTF